MVNDAPTLVYAAFPVTPEQESAIDTVRERFGVGWSELQDLMTSKYVRSRYGLSYPHHERQMGGKPWGVSRRASDRGRFKTLGHVLSREQASLLDRLNDQHGRPSGFYTAFLELAFREHFEQTYGLPWPHKDRRAEEALSYESNSS